MIKIEFFHDVICSFCFPMSARMRRIAKNYNHIGVHHRSFALGWEAEDFISNFGSREAVKPEVLSHWVHANKNDDEHRFNIEDIAVLEEAVRETSIFFVDWKAQFENDETEKAVLAGLQLAQAYGVNSAPTLVINQKYVIAGAQSQEEIEEILGRISKDELISLNKLQTLQTDDISGSCSIVDGKWKCN